MEKKEDQMYRMSTRMFIIGAILVIVGFTDYFFGPLMDARGFSFLGLVIIVVGLLVKRKDD